MSRNSLKAISWKLLCYIVCTLGCVAQIRLICVQYFSYNVNTQVIIDFGNIKPPALTLCLRNVYKIDQKRNYTPYDVDQMTPPIENILYQLSITGRTINITFTSDSNTTEALSDHVDASKSLYESMPCYTFLMKDSFTDIVKSAKSVTFYYLFTDAVKQAFNKDIYLNNPKSTFGYFDGQQVKLNTTENTISMSFDYFDITLLPLPYTTNCLDYIKTYGTTRPSLVENCIKHKYLNEYDSYLQWAEVKELNSSKLYLITDAANESVGEQYSLDDVVVACEMDYQRDECEKQIYTRYATYRPSNDEDLPDNHQAFYISGASSPSTVVIFYPKVEILDLIIYLGSTCSFWLGLVPLNILLSVPKFSESKRNRTSCKKQLVDLQLEMKQIKQLIRMNTHVSHVNSLKCKR